MCCIMFRPICDAADGSNHKIQGQPIGVSSLNLVITKKDSDITICIHILYAYRGFNQGNLHRRIMDLNGTSPLGGITRFIVVDEASLEWLLVCACVRVFACTMCCLFQALFENSSTINTFQGTYA